MTGGPVRALCVRGARKRPPSRFKSLRRRSAAVSSFCDPNREGNRTLAIYRNAVPDARSGGYLGVGRGHSASWALVGRSKGPTPPFRPSSGEKVRNAQRSEHLAVPNTSGSEHAHPEASCPRPLVCVQNLPQQSLPRANFRSLASAQSVSLTQAVSGSHSQ